MARNRSGRNQEICKATCGRNVSTGGSDGVSLAGSEETEDSEAEARARQY
jgi:hypothetical protein